MGVMDDSRDPIVWQIKGRLDNTLEREKEEKGRTCIHVAATG